MDQKINVCNCLVYSGIISGLSDLDLDLDIDLDKDLDLERDLYIEI